MTSAASIQPWGSTTHPLFLKRTNELLLTEATMLLLEAARGSGLTTAIADFMRSYAKTKPNEVTGFMKIYNGGHGVAAAILLKPQTGLYQLTLFKAKSLTDMVAVEEAMRYELGLHDFMQM